MRRQSTNQNDNDLQKTRYAKQKVYKMRRQSTNQDNNLQESTENGYWKGSQYMIKGMVMIKEIENYFNGTALANSDHCPALVRAEARAACRRLSVALLHRLTWSW